MEKDSAYKGGLELEEQHYEQIDGFTTRHKFAGTNIYIHQPPEDNIYIFCTPLNKNKIAINSTGKQSIPRFIPKNSMVPQHYKIGMQMTTFLRLAEQSSTEEILVDSMMDNVHEMFAIGYDFSFIEKSLLKLARKSGIWFSRIGKFLTVFLDTYNIKCRSSKLINFISTRNYNHTLALIPNKNTNLDDNKECS